MDAAFVLFEYRHQHPALRYPLCTLAIQVTEPAQSQQLIIQAGDGKPTAGTRADIEALLRSKITTGAGDTSTTF